MIAIPSRNVLILIAAGGSAALLLGAFGFQYLGDMPPCPMCLWQRWPHAAAVLIGVLALVVPGRILPLAGALAAAILHVVAAATVFPAHDCVPLVVSDSLDSGLARRCGSLYPVPAPHSRPTKRGIKQDG